MQQKFEIVSFECSLNALLGKNIFLYSVVLFLELMNIYEFSLGAFSERSTIRKNFKLLLQLKKILMRKK